MALAAFGRLANSYAPWELLSQAQLKAIEALIHPATFADRKAEQLPLALRKIITLSGNLDLEFLQDLDEVPALQWLRALPGVGTKIAAAVLNFSTLRKRTLVVDTHLLRVGAYLGLLPPDTDYAIGYDLFMRFASENWDADDLYEFHWLMKYHGQEICRFDAPECAQCCLQGLCPAAFRNVRSPELHQR